ncbi:Putative zn(2)Cys(6) fungal-type DNA-binding domain, fungal transcription factor [Colletotrichum destructivum]|uniref:Zn(2)Cys(6) fungal-type DNA-binding domain, fungal transcription factor n=1 Tax=Colletotrichum destructivum TaxID=34406 RepID=A0AAX4J3S0_9PEZI|nr:Putative zn(2)Cys(6) fungal-type DNA-binding domain, fungal transcription factor [Colletotrichum destructivum]
MARLGHTKSRNGCWRCKKRKVKCDEKVPCTACRRHAVRCSLEVVSVAETDAHVSHKVPGGGEHKGEESPRETVQSTEEKDRRDSRDWGMAMTHVSLASVGEISTSPSSVVGSATRRFDEQFSLRSEPWHITAFGNASVQPGYWLPAVELMVHWTTDAYRTFSYSPQTTERLRTLVPQLALSSEFLMHELLAFSALHLGHVHLGRRQVYLHQAAWHQDQAVAGLREALLNTLTPKNCKAVYASSILVVICAFASLPSGQDGNSIPQAFDRLLNIFPLITGLGAILSASNADSSLPTLRGLFAGSDKNTPGLHHHHHDLYELVDRLTRLRGQLANIEQVRETTHQRQETRHSSATLLESFKDCGPEASRMSGILVPAEILAVFLWALRAPRAFPDLVRKNHCLALVILAHYSVLLFYASKSFWFLRGWADVVMTTVEERLKGSVWSTLLEWPASVIRREVPS